MPFGMSEGVIHMIDIRRLIGVLVVCTLIAMLLQGCANTRMDEHHFSPSPLCEAIVSGNLERATTLVEQGADVNASYGCALVATASRGQLKLAELLLDRGANPNRIVSGDLTVFMGGSTPLVAAVQSRKVQVVRLLLERGANPRDDFEAFSIVLNFGDVEMAELLLRHGANANMTYPRGGNVYASKELTPTHSQQVTVPRRDLEPDRIDDTAKRFQCRLSTLSGGTSLLYLAAGQSGGPRGIGGSGSGSLDQIVKLLLAHGGNPNTKTLNGSTPLMYAASQHNHGIMTMLMDAGADVRAADRCGRTAEDYAVLSQTKALLQERQRK
ncbi:MAG: ankyrin repeat domain-containing protein [Candidatus Rokubacteria bacterium]|nr:ankyrin repeat domain-containing protein [Candidatus Rokubacteria bacterium]